MDGAGWVEGGHSVTVHFSSLDASTGTVGARARDVSAMSVTCACVFKKRILINVNSNNVMRRESAAMSESSGDTHLVSPRNR